MSIPQTCKGCRAFQMLSEGCGGHNCRLADHNNRASIPACVCKADPGSIVALCCGLVALVLIGFVGYRFWRMRANMIQERLNAEAADQQVALIANWEKVIRQDYGVTPISQHPFALTHQLHEAARQVPGGAERMDPCCDTTTTCSPPAVIMTIMDPKTKQPQNARRMELSLWVRPQGYLRPFYTRRFGDSPVQMKSHLLKEIVVASGQASLPHGANPSHPEKDIRSDEQKDNDAKHLLLLHQLRELKQEHPDICHAAAKASSALKTSLEEYEAQAQEFWGKSSLTPGLGQPLLQASSEEVIL